MNQETNDPSFEFFLKTFRRDEYHETESKAFADRMYTALKPEYPSLFRFYDAGAHRLMVIRRDNPEHRHGLEMRRLLLQAQLDNVDAMLALLDSDQDL